MKKLPLLLLLFSTILGFGQSLWRNVADPAMVQATKLPRDSNPTDFKLFTLDLEALKTALALAPMRGVGVQSDVMLRFPNASGVLQQYRIYEAPVMDAALGSRFPEIRSYVGKGIDDRSATIRFSVTPYGLHTMTLSGNQGTFYIDPYTADRTTYIVYSRKSLINTHSFVCGTDERETDVVQDLTADQLQLRSNNSLFKTYRLAMACTIEYAAFHVNAAGLNAGTIEEKKAAVLAAMAVTMTRVNGIYEIDFAITMVLIPNNLDIIFITSDEFDNSTPGVLIDQSQAVIDAAIGPANYDIGHTVSTEGGGLAQLQSPCGNSKARGITGLTSPVGDPYDVDYVSHEMGHQWGCSHTFNGDQGACNGNRTASSAYEPGSGSTIMGYSGICSPQNIQFYSDAYFHARSLIQGSAFINGSGNCGDVLANNNAAPVVSAGPNYTIPFGTAFVLHGEASDADGDALTYCWEQYNNNISPQPPVTSSAGGPNFRTFTPVSSPDRYFPQFSDVLANNLTPTWEVIPNVARTMDFSLVVRDNQTPMGGQTERATMQVAFANVGPFKVTSQNALTAWTQNSTQTVSWDVAGTTANGINTALVNIRLSVDGGLTFPYLLAQNTENDGTEDISVPDIVSDDCRLMVEAVDNIYYALNAAKILIGYQIITDCVTYDYDTAFALTPNSTAFTVKTLSVPDAGTISDVNITVNATHPDISNLNMAVIRPGGALFTYFSQQCPGSANMNVTFDSDAAPFACASPLTGTMGLPTGTLTSLNGFNQQGTWQFGFKNVTPTPNAGTINSFALEVCTQTIQLLAKRSFEFNDFALYPNPNNGSFTLQFQSGSGKPIAVAVHDMRGRIILNREFANAGFFNREIQLDRAQAGVYLVSVSDGDQKTVRRIIIE